MKKLLYILIFTLLVIGNWSLVICAASHAAYYYPQYWIGGTIQDPDAKATGMAVYFYEFLNKLQDGSGFAYGLAEKDKYLLNAGSTPMTDPFLFLGGTDYHVFIPNSNQADPANGYGADKVDVKLSRSGIDYANLVLTKGGGKIDGNYVFPPAPAAGPGAGIAYPPPLFDYIKFGNRIYQKALVEKGDKFIVPATPKILAKVQSELALKSGSLSIKINESGGPTPALTIGETKITNKELSASGVGAKSVNALSFSYDVPEENKLGEGVNTIKIYVENADGTATFEVATVTVMSGPASILGPVLTFPSPFSPTKDKTVTIQYTLSTAADIDVHIFSPTGEIVKKFILLSGQEGGNAGVNKITWDGVKPTGLTLGNAIYSGVVVSHAQGKILGKFMLSVVD
ncbi:hypothetical protein HZC34_06155 [Candidatus Saganbacteria bacterium]|nr:hypothetical protein [Candidatus Saganbacteria bacterium]